MQASAMKSSLKNHYKLVKSIDMKQYGREINNTIPQSKSSKKSKKMRSIKLKTSPISKNLVTSPLIRKKTEINGNKENLAKSTSSITSVSKNSGKPSFENLSVFKANRSSRNNLTLKERVRNLSRTLHEKEEKEEPTEVKENKR